MACFSSQSEVTYLPLFRMSFSSFSWKDTVRINKGIIFKLSLCSTVLYRYSHSFEIKCGSMPCFSFPSLHLDLNLDLTVPVVFCAACGRNAAAKFAFSRNAFRKIWQFLIRNFKSGFESKLILYQVKKKTPRPTECQATTGLVCSDIPVMGLHSIRVSIGLKTGLFCGP